MTPYEQWVALLTLMRKEIRRYTRIWTQTLLPSAITMSLYFLIFGNLIGSRIGEMGGVSYMEFVVPGLIMMAIVTNSYANVVSSFFGSKFNNSIEELLVSPTPNHIILLGFVSGGVSRGMLVAVSVTLVASLFVDLSIHSYIVVVAVVAMTSILFSLCGLINAVFANTFDDISCYIDVQFSCRVIVEKEQRLCAHYGDIVTAHCHKINADGLVPTQLHGETEFCAHPVGT